jgi:hypothetical protein
MRDDPCTASVAGLWPEGVGCAVAFTFEFIGRPGRPRLLPSTLKMARETPGAWIAPAGHIAAHAAASAREREADGA